MSWVCQKQNPSGKRQKFTICLHEREIQRIKAWVKAKPEIETGGDLFGLWIDDSAAVVQFVLGPGKNCRRTVTSFSQDIHYLNEAGSYLTESHGLCNVGQWHSHHTIPLYEPSAGDYNTVWSHMPQLGLARYIVLIANIKLSEVTLNCFLFEIKNGQTLTVEKAPDIHKLSGDSPIRLNQAVEKLIRKRV